MTTTERMERDASAVGEAEGRGAPRRRRRRVLIAILAVLLAAGATAAVAVFVWAADDDDPSGGVTIDDFDRTTRAGLGQLSPKVAWRERAGSWRVRDGEAVIVRPGEEVSLAAVTTESSEMQIAVAMIASEGAGVAYAVRDEDDFRAVIAAPTFATWNVYRVIDGEPEYLGNTGLSPVEGAVTVSIRVNNGITEVAIDGQPRLTLQDRTSGTGAGLAVLGRAADGRWLRFELSS